MKTYILSLTSVPVREGRERSIITNFPNFSTPLIKSESIISIKLEETRSSLSTIRGYTTSWHGVADRSSSATLSIATETSSKGWMDMNYIEYLSLPPRPPKVSERTIVPTETWLSVETSNMIEWTAGSESFKIRDFVSKLLKILLFSGKLF